MFFFLIFTETHLIGALKRAWSWEWEKFWQNILYKLELINFQSDTPRIFLIRRMDTAAFYSDDSCTRK